jgi:putative ABC transport system permease protein
MQGRWVSVGDEGKLAVNEAFQRRYPELRVGDTLRLRVDGRERDWQIVGIFQFTGVDELIAYTNYDYLARVVAETAKTATYRIASTDHSLEFQTQLSRAMDNWFRDRGFKVSSTEAGGSLTRSITEYIGILTAFLVVMALLTAVVGSIGLAGTLSMNVMERTREIGVLRAIGAGDRMILKLVLVEGLLIGGISFIIATLLSFPITAVLSQAISQAIFNAPANFAFTLQGFLVWLGVVLALSTLASLAPARNASRMTIREVLAYE